MYALQTYLLSVTAAALLSAAVQALLPAGPVRRVCAMSCALLLFLVVVKPVRRLEPETLTAAARQYWQALEVYPEELEETDAALTERIIRERSQAYIQSEAAEEGIQCTVTVDCRSEEGIAVPVCFTVAGMLNHAQRERLRGIIRKGFGTDAAVQFTEEGNTDGAAKGTAEKTGAEVSVRPADPAGGGGIAGVAHRAGEAPGAGSGAATE